MPISSHIALAEQIRVLEVDGTQLIHTWSPGNSKNLIKAVRP